MQTRFKNEEHMIFSSNWPLRHGDAERSAQQTTSACIMTGSWPLDVEIEQQERRFSKHFLSFMGMCGNMDTTGMADGLCL